MFYSRGHSQNEYRGVYWQHISNKWCAALYLGNRQRLHLGSYLSPVEAAKAYDKAAIEFYGLSAVVNFPELKPKIGWLHIFDMQPKVDRGVYISLKTMIPK